MQPYPQPSAGSGVRICPGCGVIAPTARTSCSVCQTPFGAPVLAAGRVGPLVFACIHGCEFTCKACGIKSPLGTLELEGQAECWGCGIVQAFDVAQWTDALGFAHGVADLAGFGPSRHAEIGTQYTSSTKQQNGLIMDAGGTRTHSLSTTVSPGHPLCTTCRSPLDVATKGETTSTRCARCGAAATYALPPNSVATYPALRGIIAAEARSDQPIARVVRGAGGVEAPGCPQCGATLTAGEGEIVNCTFCNANARIPGRLARQQRRGQAPKMVPFWVLLDGMSPGRRNIARGREEDAEEDGEPLPDFGRPSWGAAPGPMPTAPWMQAPMPPVRRGTNPIVFVLGAVGLLLVLGIAGAAYYFTELADSDPAPQPVKTKPKKK